MTTIAITYNERNIKAKKAIEFILSLGHFKVEETISPAKKKDVIVLKNTLRLWKNETNCILVRSEFRSD